MFGSGAQRPPPKREDQKKTLLNQGSTVINGIREKAQAELDRYRGLNADVRAAVEEQIRQYLVRSETELAGAANVNELESVVRRKQVNLENINQSIRQMIKENEDKYAQVTELENRARQVAARIKTDLLHVFAGTPEKEQLHALIVQDIHAKDALIKEQFTNLIMQAKASIRRVGTDDFDDAVLRLQLLVEAQEKKSKILPETIASYHQAFQTKSEEYRRRALLFNYEESVKLFRQLVLLNEALSPNENSGLIKSLAESKTIPEDYRFIDLKRLQFEVDSKAKILQLPENAQSGYLTKLRFRLEAWQFPISEKALSFAKELDDKIKHPATLEEPKPVTIKIEREKPVEQKRKDSPAQQASQLSENANSAIDDILLQAKTIIDAYRIAASNADVDDEILIQILSDMRDELRESQRRAKQEGTEKLSDFVSEIKNKTEKNIEQEIEAKIKEKLGNENEFRAIKNIYDQNKRTKEIYLLKEKAQRIISNVKTRASLYLGMNQSSSVNQHEMSTFIFEEIEAKLTGAKTNLEKLITQARQSSENYQKNPEEYHQAIRELEAFIITQQAELDKAIENISIARIRVAENPEVALLNNYTKAIEFYERLSQLNVDLNLPNDRIVERQDELKKILTELSMRVTESSEFKQSQASSPNYQFKDLEKLKFEITVKTNILAEENLAKKARTYLTTESKEEIESVRINRLAILDKILDSGIVNSDIAQSFSRKLNESVEELKKKVGAKSSTSELFVAATQQPAPKIETSHHTTTPAVKTPGKPV